MAQLAAYAGCTIHYIVRTEQGVYADPPLNVLEELHTLLWETDSDKLHDIDLQTLSDAYTAWQWNRRLRSKGELIVGFDFHTHDTLEHPFTHWRMHSGLTAQIAVSKLFCVHPALMHRFETKPWLCSTPPTELVEGLLGAGYLTEAADLGVAYEEYRKGRREL